VKTAGQLSAVQLSEVKWLVSKFSCRIFARELQHGTAVDDTAGWEDLSRCCGDL
jgi:hypothetical protein